MAPRTGAIFAKVLANQGVTDLVKLQIPILHLEMEILK